MPNLAIAPVVNPGNEAPEKWLLFLHGILGSGSNWRTFARQIVGAKKEESIPRPATDWGALLVDLRLHGDSVGFEPPHTLATSAADIVPALAGKKTRALVGHSFGGKVGIALAGLLADSENGPLDHLFVIDSTPSARADGRGSSGVRDIVELLTQLPEEFADRAAFQRWIEGHGVSRPTAMWLAMNVRPDASGRYVFRMDIASVRTMMDDYFAQDLWSIIENPPGNMQTHIISGARSEVVDRDDLERARAARRCTVDVIPDAGHWVHVDAPETLRGLVLKYLSGL